MACRGVEKSRITANFTLEVVSTSTLKRQILNYGLFSTVKYHFSLPKSHNYGAISTQNHVISLSFLPIFIPNYTFSTHFHYKTISQKSQIYLF